MLRSYSRGSATDQEILLLWRAGKNTNDMASQLWCDEADIANRLARILERARQDQEWNYDRLTAATA